MKFQAVPSNCPALSTLQHGTIKPAICLGSFGNRVVPDMTVCNFECDSGYKLMGRKSLTCHGNSRHPKWMVGVTCFVNFHAFYTSKTCDITNKFLFQYPAPTCSSNFPEPFIMCPSDIKKSLSGSSSSVYVMFPQPKTNVDWFRQDIK